MGLQRVNVTDGTARTEGGSTPSGDTPASTQVRPELSALGSRTSVVIGIRDLGLHQEVLDYLERDPRIDVVGATAEPESLAARIREAPGSAAVVCGDLVGRLARPLPVGPHPLFVVAQEMTVPILRDAVQAAARGVYAWPSEREDLAREIRRARSQAPGRPSARGRVIAVFGARGGVGATFLSTHLAAALADRGLPTALVDLDASFSDVTAALGIEPGASVRTIADLVPVIDELSPDHVEQVLYRHERGFAVLLGPPSDAGDAADQVPAGLFSACVALLAGAYREVVLHIPRSMDTVARTGIEIADERFLVVALDLLSLYGARRAVGGLGLDRGGRPWRVLVNRARRGEVAPGDVERVLGRRPDATVRFDPAVPRVQNRGELLRAKSGRAWKDVARLAARLAEAGAAGREEGA